MSHSSKKLTRVLIAAATILAIPISCYGQRNTSQSDNQDYVSRSKYLIKALNPNLDPNMRVVFTDLNRLGESGVMNGFSVELFSDNIQTRNPADAPRCPVPVLRAQFLFDFLSRNQNLMRFISSDSITRKNQEEFNASLEEHPEWSSEQALRSPELKFGPQKKNELLQKVPSEVLKQYIGDFIVTSAAFQFDKGQGGNFSPTVQWSVEVKTSGSQASGDSYTLTFEPFRGTLTSIVRNP